MSNTTNTLNNHLANENTFLSWIRTSLALMAFGFVIERFSLFLKQVTLYFGKISLAAPVASHASQNYPSMFGIFLVAVGALICFFSFIKFKKIEQQINTDSYQPTTLLVFILALIVFLSGIFLVLYLIKII